MTGVQTCALPISSGVWAAAGGRARTAFAPSSRGVNLRALFPRQTPHDPAPLDPPHPHVRPDLQLALAAAAAVPGADRRAGDLRLAVDRKSVVSGKSVSVRVELGGRRCIKKKKT